MVTEADVTAALEVLREAGWRINDDSGRGHLTGDILIHAGPPMAHIVNLDPQAYGYPAGTVVTDAPTTDYARRAAYEPWRETSATVPDQEATPGPDAGG